MKQSLLILATLFLGTGIMSAQNYEDDIYYNPNKTKTTAPSTGVKTSATADNMMGNITADGYYYNPNLGEYAVLSESDVDAYNRYGSYYETDLDTIGAAVGNSEDFVYTQQIQKFYNPTIVTDNADALEAVLNNSYGNVNVVYTGGCPTFTAWSYSPWYVYSPWSWRWYGPGWSFGWDPLWSWTWSPTWAWGPSWAWGWYDPWYWGPGWGATWGWGWHHPGYHPYGPNHHRGMAGRPGNGHPNLGLGRGNYRSHGGVGGGLAGSGSGRYSGGRASNSRGNGRFGTISGVNTHRGNSNIATDRQTDYRHNMNGATNGNNTHRGSAAASARSGLGNISTNNNNRATLNSTSPGRNSNMGNSRGSSSNYNRGNSGSQHRSSGSYNSGGSRGGFSGGSRGGSSHGGSRGGGSHRR